MPLIAPGIALALAVAAPAAAEPSLTARAAVVMDAATGEVLFERNASQPLPPASTTKVMTAIVALESGRLDESLRVSPNAAETAPSKINLRAGQRIQLRSLLYALLLNSANDAAEVIAEGVGGSEEQFATLMNERARQLGARTAHFVNPHGLTASGHVASALDLATIFRHAIRQPLLREILATREVRVPIESASTFWVSLHSHNRLLTGYQYPVIGKTGYTRPARRCFVGAATHDDREIIIALLGASDLWGDAKRLFAVGFGVPERPPVMMARAGRHRRLARRAHVVPARAEGDAEPPAEAHAASAASRFAVQIGPFTSRRAAAASRGRLAHHGYTALMTGRTLRLGSFSDRSRAERLAERLQSTGYRATVIALR